MVGKRGVGGRKEGWEEGEEGLRDERVRERGMEGERREEGSMARRREGRKKGMRGEG